MEWGSEDKQVIKKNGNVKGKKKIRENVKKMLVKDHIKLMEIGEQVGDKK